MSNVQAGVKTPTARHLTPPAAHTAWKSQGWSGSQPSCLVRSRWLRTILLVALHDFFVAESLGAEVEGYHQILVLPALGRGTLLGYDPLA